MRKGTCVLVLLAALLGVSAASVTSASAQAKVFKWKLQTVDDASLMEYKLLAVKFADRVRELSNGRLDIKVFPAGGLSPSYEVFDAVKKGLIDMSQHYLVYVRVLRVGRHARSPAGNGVVLPRGWAGHHA